MQNKKFLKIKIFYCGHQAAGDLVLLTQSSKPLQILYKLLPLPLNVSMDFVCLRSLLL